MRWTFTPYIQDETANPTFRRLLNFDQSLAELVTAFPRFEEVKETIMGRAFDQSKRAVLSRVLVKQNQELASDLSLINCVKLADENTFTVTTGHQLNIFSGPAFFVYKIAHTIALANELTSKMEGYTVVPIYWMASEDHDLEEINHFHAFKETLTWKESYTGAVGAMAVSQLNEVLQQWKQVMRWEDDHPRFKLFASYVSKSNLAEATRFLVNELFGKHGIVVLDANNKELKSIFAPQMAQEIGFNVGQKQLEAVKTQLEEANLSAQVNGRDINLFYLTDSDRLRLTVEEDKIITVGGAFSWSKSELLEELQKEPQRFSPNVVLRPVYQEVILPNVAYVGGPGELSYWLQLKPLFDELNVPYPALIPRNGATILAGHQVKKMEKLKVSVSDLKHREEDIVAKWIESNSQINTALDEEKKGLQVLFEGIQEQLKQVDINLLKKGEGSLIKGIKELEGLEKAMERAVKSKNDTSIKQLISLKESLFPEGSPQERHQTYFALEAALGESIIDELIRNFSPFNSGMSVISPE